MARSALRGLGELFVTIGAILLLFVVYELWVTGLYTDREQAQLRQQLEAQWEQQPDAAVTPVDTAGVEPVPLGAGLAVLRIPLLGEDWHPVVIEGVDREALRRGPGHIPGTALPGEVGNFVVSGHRTTYGAPFNRFDELRPGVPVVVETADAWLTYRVTEMRVGPPTAVEVTWPVPGVEGAEPSEALLTLTTCHPEFSAEERLVVHAVLDARTPKADGPPAVLEG